MYTMRTVFFFYLAAYPCVLGAGAIEAYCTKAEKFGSAPVSLIYMMLINEIRVFELRIERNVHVILAVF